MGTRWKHVIFLSAASALVGALESPWWSEALDQHDHFFHEKPQSANDIAWTPLSPGWTLVPLPPQPQIILNDRHNHDDEWKTEPPVITKYSHPPPPKTTQAPDIEREDWRHKVFHGKPPKDEKKIGKTRAQGDVHPPVDLKPPSHSRPERITGYVPAVRGPIDGWIPGNSSKKSKILSRIDPIWLKLF